MDNVTTLSTGGRVCTCIAPINIAVIKYWGKSDEEQIIPLNDSISVTLDTGYMYTKTTAKTSPEITEDSIILNQQEASSENIRFKNCLSEVRKLAAQSNNADAIQRSKWNVEIITENNFPTKAGLASSASGYACLVYTLAQLYELDANSSELSALARRGSGSACRSLFGGFVRWYHQSTPCVARPIAEAAHWPELRCLVAVVTSDSKTVGSTEGMQRSVETSGLLQHRIKHVVPERVEKMQQAILERNFDSFGRLTMQDSNQFHAICLDTYPPLFYMNGTSQAIIQLVHRYNQLRGAIKVAYTFDAGSNAFLFLEENDIALFANVLYTNFGSSSNSREDFLKGIPVPFVNLNESNQDFPGSCINDKCLQGRIEYVISCGVGKGPRKLN